MLSASIILSRLFQREHGFLMSKKILVGNLVTSVEDSQIKDFFSESGGTIVSITIPKDPISGICRGYAFVEMNSIAETQEAIHTLNGKEVAGRAVVLTLDSPPTKKRKWYEFGKP